VRPHIHSARRGFTVAELLIAIGLSAAILLAVLNAYIFVARSYTRTIGFGLPNEPTLESQGRRVLATLARDVQMSSAISGSLSASEVTLAVPRPTGGTQNVTYYYNSTPAAVTVYSVSVPATSLVRIDRTTNTALPMHSSLLTCVFTYYDDSGNPYTTYTNYLIGIKQLSLVLTAQTGNSVNRTQTRVYQIASPRLLFRNKSPLP
jgi:Tfp pilus assembly protein PilW